MAGTSAATRLQVLAQLYEELRAYRGKEFQTFQFAFAITGAGLLPPLLDEVWIKGFLTLFATTCIYYLVKNNQRMMLIKEEIRHFQRLLGVERDFVVLVPAAWAGKRGLTRHLGVMIYCAILTVEAVFLWLLAYSSLPGE